ncbi:MAG: lysylphosphatidylglycerol synthase transmembrane domain-containing protein [bacterium]|nr:lysylphosphatidylglycerol synthase transmembrane domain-containing protein [bacterium]
MLNNFLDLNAKMVKKIIIGLIMGIFLLLIWSLYIDIDFSKVMGYISSVDYSYIFLSTIFYTLAYFFRSVRWKIILAQVHSIKYITSFALYVAGMLINFFIPCRAGDIARCVFLKKLANINISRSLPSVFMDKVMDVFPVLIILPLIFIFSFSLSRPVFVLIYLITSIFIILLLIILISVKKTGLILNIFKYFISLAPDRFINFKLKSINSLDHFFKEIITYFKNKTIIFYTILFSFLSIASDALFFYFFLLGFGSSLSLLKVFFGYTLIQLSYVLPYPPAQIGSNEILWVIIFCATFGLNRNIMSAITLSAHLWIFLFHILAGSAAIFSLWYRIKLHLISIMKSQKESFALQNNTTSSFS